MTINGGDDGATNGDQVLKLLKKKKERKIKRKGSRQRNKLCHFVLPINTQKSACPAMVELGFCSWVFHIHKIFKANMQHIRLQCFTVDFTNQDYFNFL